MKIAQALKEKNKIGAKLAKKWDNLRDNNSIIEGSTRTYEPVELMKEIDEMTQNLIELKTKIHQASGAVRFKIFRLSELKMYVMNLRRVSSRNGLVKERYDSVPLTMDAIYKTNEIDDLIEKVESEIDKIQEELDTFNHQISI